MEKQKMVQEVLLPGSVTEEITIMVACGRQHTDHSMTVAPQKQLSGGKRKKLKLNFFHLTMNHLQRVGLLINCIFSSNLHRKQGILNFRGYIFLRIWHFNIEWLITLSNVLQLQAVLLSALIRGVLLSSERCQLQSHSYTRYLEKVTVKCSAPNKTLIPSSLKFREHCTRKGRGKKEPEAWENGCEKPPSDKT